MSTKIIHWLTKHTTSFASVLELKSTIIPRIAHHVSRSKISDNALKVLYRLKKGGFKAYLVGGGIRDLLLELYPKDFDVVTDAHPKEIRRLFRNCRLIARRFRLAHIYFASEIIEVATFRARSIYLVLDNEQYARHDEDGMIIRDNIYGNIDEDVLRRDFTINALYYNIRDCSLVDYVGGLEDIKKRQLRIIGDSYVRYCEDPVRMLRAIRLAIKLDFSLHIDTEWHIKTLASNIQNVPGGRLFEEMIKLFLSGYGYAIFEKLKYFGIFKYLFPQTHRCLDLNLIVFLLIKEFLLNTDIRIAEHKSVSSAFLFAVFLWYPVKAKIDECIEYGLLMHTCYQYAIGKILGEQLKIISLPKRIIQMMREIWLLQLCLAEYSRRDVFRLYQLPRFRAAYDFLLIRAKFGGEGTSRSLVVWWKAFVVGNDYNRLSMANDLSSRSTKCFFLKN